jgi:hypothetical protein
MQPTLLAYAALDHYLACCDVKAGPVLRSHLVCESADEASYCKQLWVAAKDCGAVCCAGQRPNDGCRTISTHCTQDETSVAIQVAVPGYVRDEIAAVAASHHEHQVWSLESDRWSNR